MSHEQIASGKLIASHIPIFIFPVWWDSNFPWCVSFPKHATIGARQNYEREDKIHIYIKPIILFL